jgi:8-oxo-dGTP pyrophosphatase MutT (NUDIX family)
MGGVYREVSLHVEDTMTLDKVTAFITRETAAGRELLVFQHPTAGIQLPAGTVNLNESIEAALFREIREETGMTAVRLVKHLCTIRQPLEPEERLVVKDTILQSSPGEDGTLVKAVILRRGVTVRVIGADANYDQVAFPEYQLHGSELIQVSARTGWVAHRNLTHEVRRHLFHLSASAPTPHHWMQRADDHNFSLFWVPLTEDPGLIPAQEYWYNLVKEQLKH